MIAGNRPRSSGDRNLESCATGKGTTMSTVIAEVQEKAERARAAALKLAEMTRAEKDRVLLAMADAIEAHAAEILAANAKDVTNVQQRKTNAPVDRLMLNEKRVTEMAAALREVAALAIRWVRS